MKVKYVPVENAVAEWGDKKSLLKRWEGLNQYTLNRWITEMRDHRQFSNTLLILLISWFLLTSMDLKSFYAGSSE